MSQRPAAIITGAGSGIGRATAVLLSQSGHDVALIGRTESTLRETAELCERGSAAHVVCADLVHQQAIDAIADQCLKKFGRLDVLVNNAALCETRPIEKTYRELLLRTFQTNHIAPALLVARLWRTFMEQRGGCVVNVSSMSSIDPFPGLSAYAASKAALESLTRSIMTEGRQHGLRAFSIAPGAVETAMLRLVVSREDLPPQRTLDPSHVAKVIVDCVLGHRDDQVGKTIILPSP